MGTSRAKGQGLSEAVASQLNTVESSKIRFCENFLTPISDKKMVTTEKLLKNIRRYDEHITKAGSTKVSAISVQNQLILAITI